MRASTNERSCIRARRSCFRACTSQNRRLSRAAFASSTVILEGDAALEWWRGDGDEGAGRPLAAARSSFAFASTRFSCFLRAAATACDSSLKSPGWSPGPSASEATEEHEQLRMLVLVDARARNEVRPRIIEPRKSSE